MQVGGMRRERPPSILLPPFPASSLSVSLPAIKWKVKHSYVAFAKVKTVKLHSVLT